MVDAWLRGILVRLRSRWEGEPDDGLLGRFCARGDEEAFAALLGRHGSMVYGVCRRTLRQPEDAEDAFQATFLVLARRAGSIRKRGSLASWLFGVAHRIATQAKHREARRRRREKRAAPPRQAESAALPADQELRAVLDQELSRLPEKYRAPMVLHYLEGRTKEEAARELGWPVGTVSGRLARARVLLRARLTRRGLAVTAAWVTAALSPGALEAAPGVLETSTIEAAALFAAGQTQGGAASAAAFTLAERMLQTMLHAKLRIAAAWILALALLAAGGLAWDGWAAPEQPLAPAAAAAGGEKKMPRRDRMEKPATDDEIAWGKPVNGLRAGMGFALPRRRYHVGEKVTFVFKLQNVSNQPIHLEYQEPAFPRGGNPTILDANEKRAPALYPPLSIPVQARQATLAPGKSLDLGQPGFLIQPPELVGKSAQVEMLGPPGKYKVTQHITLEGDPTEWSGTLVSGKLDLEVLPPAARQAEPEKEAKAEQPSGELFAGPAPSRAGEGDAGRARAADSEPAYPTADVVVQYRDESGREVRAPQQFRVTDAETVARLASHFPGILGDRGSGPRVMSAGKRATLTIMFNHKSGEAAQLRVAHVTPDYSTWWWRDNTPYTGDRHVEGKDRLRELLERLAAKNKVDLK
jgi:RNA polymerase sigma factor (sigma-70 family)